MSVNLSNSNPFFTNEEHRLSAITKILIVGLVHHKCARECFMSRELQGNIALVAKPKNEHDENAVALVSNNNVVGYASKGQTSQVHELLNSGKQLHIMLLRHVDFSHAEVLIGTSI